MLDKTFVFTVKGVIRSNDESTARLILSDHIRRSGFLVSWYVDEVVEEEEER